MIGLIIIVLIVIILFSSFSKFTRLMKQNENLLQEINFKISFDPDNIELRFIKAECLMKLQNYHQATREYEYLISNGHKLTRFKNEIANDSKLNLSFCIKPFPWSTIGLYDRGGSYWHYQLLIRFGNRRVYTAINLM